MSRTWGAIAFAAMTAICVGGGSAFAAPPGFISREGHWFAPDGKPAYTYAKDTPNVSTCTGGCLVAWPAVKAGLEAKADSEWTVIKRADGASQWAYHGKPLYTYAADEVGQGPTGASPTWLALVVSAMPGEVKDVGGALRATSDGRPLYWNRKDPKNGTSCVAGCAVAWPPVVASAGAANSGEWTLIGRPDGAKQWAFMGSAVYTYMADDPDGAPTGLSETWTKPGAPAAPPAPPPPPPKAAAPVAVAAAPPAPPPQKLLGAVAVSDPRITQAPRLLSQLKLGDWYPAASMKDKESGKTSIEQCIDAKGQPSELTVARSSGFPRLDEATIKMLERARYEEARAGKTPVAVCGFRIEIVWDMK